MNQPLVLRRVSAYGQTFVHTDTGDGPLVVLLHGFPDTPSGWYDTSAALNAAGYRTVVPYLRGYHPETIVPGRRYRLEDIGTDVIRLLDALDEPSAVIVGHDWGASIAYGAVALAPTRVRAICTVAIPHPATLRPDLTQLWAARHFLTLRLPTAAWLTRRSDFAYVDILMRRWAPRWTGPEREATLRGVKQAFADPVVLDGALAYYRALRLVVPPPVTRPALIVGGTTDVVPAALFRRTSDHCVGPCEVLIVEGAGHWPHRENASLFQQRLTAFLGDLD